MSGGIRKKRLFIYISLALLVVLTTFTALYIYKQFSKPIVDFHGAKKVDLLIPTGSNFEYVQSALKKSGVLLDERLFVLMSKKKNYNNKVRPGKYSLTDQMTANELINMLRSGKQPLINFTFTNIRFVDKLAGLASKKLELDSSDLSAMFHNDAYLQEYGFNSQTVVALFLPNTYQFYWILLQNNLCTA